MKLERLFPTLLPFVHSFSQIGERRNSSECYITFTCFCVSKYKCKLLDFVPHLPPSLSLTSFSIDPVKRNLLVYKIECIWAAALYSMYVSSSNKVTWYYGWLVLHLPAQFGRLGFPKMRNVVSSELVIFVWVSCTGSISVGGVEGGVSCVLITTRNTQISVNMVWNTWV